MNHFSSMLGKKILESYIKASRKVIRLAKTHQISPNSHLSDLEIHGFDSAVWFLSTPFYVINKGIKFDIPAGFCISFDAELNVLSRLLLRGRYPRVVIVLVWFRDILEYKLPELKLVMDDVLKNEGFGSFRRSLILCSLRLT